MQLNMNNEQYVKVAGNVVPLHIIPQHSEPPSCVESFLANRPLVRDSDFSQLREAFEYVM